MAPSPPLPAFRDILGHEEAIAFFVGAARQERLAQAYLLHGPDGVGKTALSLRLAAAMTCPAPFGECPGCDPCRAAAAGNHSDVVVLAARGGQARHKIDAVKDFARQAYLSPENSPCRVLVLERADLLGTDAADAFLKTLEEPPATTRFLLTAVRRGRVAPTIRSRCQCLGLGPVEPERLAAWLSARGGDGARATLAAAAAGGAPGRALRLLESPAILEARDGAIRGFLEGESGGEPFPECLHEAAANDDFGGANDPEIPKGERSRDGIRLRLLAVLALLRDAIAASAAPRACPALAPNRAAESSALASSLGIPSLRSMFDAVADALAEISRNLNPRLVLDVLGDRLRAAGWRPSPQARA